jgi:putative PIN family toxin of toxin-antitoxin system
MGAQQGVAPPRVVLDTNAVLSALLFANGRLRWLRIAWQQVRITPVINQSTTIELVRVLAYPKFRLSPIEQEDMLAEYLPYCEVAVSLEDIPLPPVRDVADKKFLQLAMTSAVAFLVTGDADLLSLAGAAFSPAVSIITPEQLRLILAAAS